MKPKRLPEIQHKFNKQADAVMVELQKLSTMISPALFDVHSNDFDPMMKIMEIKTGLELTQTGLISAENAKMIFAALEQFMEDEDDED